MYKINLLINILKNVINMVINYILKQIFYFNTFYVKMEKLRYMYYNLLLFIKIQCKNYDKNELSVIIF